MGYEDQNNILGKGTILNRKPEFQNPNNNNKDNNINKDNNNNEK